MHQALLSCAMVPKTMYILYRQSHKCQRLDIRGKKKKSFTVRVVKHTVFLENSLPREVVDASCLFKRNFANA